MKLLLKLILALIVIVPVSLAAYLAYFDQAEPFPARSESAARLAPGPWSVERFENTWIDRRRRTQANGDFPGAAERTLVGDVWFPGIREDEDSADAVTDGFPLLIFSHGFTSMRQNSTYLAEHLASHGFVVAAVDYPLTSMGAPGGPMVEDVVNQPGDVSFLIDSLIAASAEAGHALVGKIHPERIGVVGISLGGLTSTLVGFHPDWKDPRISAVISIAGPTNFFTKEFFAGSRLPFLMLAGDIDALVPYASNASPVPAKVPGGELLTIEGGSHTGFSGRAAWLRIMRNTDAVGCFSVMRAIEEGSRDRWAGLMGSPEQGIDYDVEDELCKVDPLPATIHVLRQQMISRVVVTAFFERYLIDDAARRRAAGRFLERDIEAELREVDYRRSRLPPPPEPTADDEEDALTDVERRLINLMFEQSINPNNKAGTGGR